MPSSEQMMTSAQLVSLLDEALCSHCPLAFLDATVKALKVIGRHRDAMDAAWLGCLYAEGEIELLMSLCAAWERGERALPSETARKAPQRRRTADDDALQQPVGRA